MSLQLAAQHLSDQGRGPDTTLVHMSNKEVKSLNDLAMAHGGQLTINPQTGLPEAGFLSSMLPMIAGAALTATTGLPPMAIAGIVGGGSMLLNPKQGLMGGLMAGLGAYGGAGLGESLAATGMQEAGKQKMIEQTMQEATKNAALEGTVLPSNYANLVQQQTFAPALQGDALRGAISNQGFTQNLSSMGEGVKSAFTPGGFSNLAQNMGGASGILKTGLAAAAPLAIQPTVAPPAATGDKDMGQRYTYSANRATPLPAPDVPTYQKMNTEPGNFGAEQSYFVDPKFKAVTNEEAKNIYHFAGGGPVEQMSNNNAIGANTGFPQAYLHNNAYATPYQTPISQNVLTGAGDVSVDPYTGEQRMADGGISGSGNLDLSIPLNFGNAGAGGFGGAGVNGYNAVGSGGGSQTPFVGQNNTGTNALGVNTSAFGQPASTGNSDLFNAVGNSGNPFDSGSLLENTYQPGAGPQGPGAMMANGGMAMGGISDAGYNLGGYSDGGRLLRGPGDGVSDSIPATIGHKQPARLADGEFVVPARIVSELGNGSTEAGARKLYAMLDRIQASRKNTVGKGKVAKNNRADKYLPA